MPSTYNNEFWNLATFFPDQIDRNHLSTHSDIRLQASSLTNMHNIIIIGSYVEFALFNVDPTYMPCCHARVHQVIHI